MKFPKEIITESDKYKTIDYSKFTIVNESLYSSVRPYQIIQIEKILKKIFVSPTKIIDACAHIGCWSINLANIFKTAHIISPEINKDVYDILVSNITAYKVKKRVSPIHINFLTFVKKLKSEDSIDFIAFDPPWGGPSYVKSKKMMLYLTDDKGENIPLYNIINDIFIRNLTQFVTIIVPNNFNLDEFVDNLKFGKFSMVWYAINRFPINPNRNAEKIIGGIIYMFLVIKKTNDGHINGLN